MAGSLLPGFGPPRVTQPGPLVKEIHLSIHLDGCKGLPRSTLSAEGSAPREFFVGIWYISSRGVDSVPSSNVYEGTGCHQGTVRWDETLYITCLDHSIIQIYLFDGEYNEIAECVCPAGDLLQVSSITLPPLSWTPFRHETTIECTLYISASTVPTDAEEENCELDDESSVVSKAKDAHSGLRSTAISWEAAFRGLSSFAGAVSRANFVRTPVHDTFCTQLYVHEAYQACSTRQFNNPQITNLVDTFMNAVNTCVQVRFMRMLQSKDCLGQIARQLYWLSDLMYYRANNRDPDFPDEYREQELARLVLIFVTPDPPTGINSTSTGGDWTAIYGTIAKDVLLCALDALAQSSDALSPLKSVAGGLMFFVTWADLVSSNKEDIREMCERIGSLVEYFKLVITDGSPLSPALDNTIKTLARDINKLNGAVEEIVAERKSRLRRYVSAKKHQRKLEGVARKLDEARGNYTAAVVTLNATTIANVNAHVQAYTLLVGATPMHLPGTRRADVSSFPVGVARIEEA
ncbi:unnamed protein product [Peniophora sp. CBMAI 1063]|nr:unnamed protein product [Peniophora sp. CBMAI 1063]